MDKTIIHNPVFRISGNDTEPTDYSLTTHNHDGVYATAGHNHDGIYSPVGHTHDFSGDFAAIYHNHDGTYSLVGHTHDYSAVFAAIDHNHDSTYAPKSHSDTTTGNPHSVTAAEVGNDTAQWNAAKLQGKAIASAAPTDGQVQTWNETAQEWQPATPPGSTGGEANTASNLGAGTGLFASKSGVDLQFNSIAAGDGISISVASNTITIASSIKNKFDATTAPTVDNGTTEGYSVGSRWIDVTNDKVYDCVDVTDGAAVWNEVGAGTDSSDAGTDPVARRMIAEIEFDRMVADAKSAQYFSDGFFDIFTDSTGVDFDNSVNIFPNIFNDSYVKLLLEGDASPFVDDSSSAKSLTNSGVTLDTTNKKYGAGAMSFDGSSHIDAGTSADWSLGTTWTIDMWVRPTAFVSDNIIASTRNTGNDWALLLNGSGNIRFGSYSSGLHKYSTAALSLTVFTHIAVTYDGTNLKFWINGQLDSTHAVTQTWPTSNKLFIGQSEPYPGEVFTGQIDRLRISKGIVRWTENFDPEQDALHGYLGTIDYGTVLNMTAISETVTSPITPTVVSADLLVETAGTADTDWFIDALESTGNWVNMPLTLVKDYGSNVKRYTATATLSSADTGRAYRLWTDNNTAFECTRAMLIWE